MDVQRKQTDISYDIVAGVLAINPKAKITCIEEDYDRITWLYGTTPISKSDIQAKQAELKAAYDTKDYQRKREPEYPAIVDQLDDLYHNGLDGWKSTIKVIKDKYPK